MTKSKKCDIIEEKEIKIMYEFITYTDNKDRKVILCLKRYKGKVIKGKAICHPEDTYNEEVGKLIAQKRCESHYLEKRIKEKYAYLKSKEAGNGRI